MNRSMMILIIWSTCNFIFGQSVSFDTGPKYIVTKRLLSNEDGLASHEVYCSLQDKAGFMWFGTRNGLNRYDGENSIQFTRQRNNLQDTKVVQLAKDDANNIFIEYGSAGFQLTTNGKVDVMNSITKEVKTLTETFPNMPFKEQDVYWISNDGTDEINFLTADPFRLWKYSSKNGFHLEYEIKAWDRQDAFPFDDFRNTGPFCIFTKNNSLLKIFKRSIQYILSRDSVMSFRQPDILSSLPIGFTSHNELLIAYLTDSNPYAFDVGKVTQEGMIPLPIDGHKFNTERITGKFWNQIICASDGTSAILYDDTDALYLWNENFFIKVASKSEINGFENLFLYQLYKDNYGNLWLCTSNGVLQLKIEMNRFTHYFSARQQSSESNPQVRGIYANNDGEVIANVWTHTFFQQNKNMKFVANDQINYALTPHDSILYSGGFSLFTIDKERSKIIKLPETKEGEIWSMLSVNDSLLLMGRTNGFSLYNSRQHKLEDLFNDSENIPEAKFVYRIFQNKTNTIWAVAENGLYMLTWMNNKWSIVKEQSPFISALNFLDAYIDESGIFWLATSGEGLFRWDSKTDLFKQFSINDGFSSDVLYRIEPDAYGNLWISSDHGLIRFNKTTFTVKTYTTVDGISHNEFNRTSSYKTPEGRLFFGGIDGVNGFYPKDFITDTNSFNVPLQILDYNQYVGSQNRLVNKTTDLLHKSEIVLAPDDQFFTLKFQLLDFSKDEIHRYAYTITGVDKQWNYINENSIRISGLPYGNFTLRIKAQNREGAWNQSELIIPLLVMNPFYLNWWFIVTMILLFIVSIYLIIKWRTHQLATDKIKLEQTVNERTTQLKQSISDQAEMLVEKDILMKEIHHRVKNNLQVISGLLELQGKNLKDRAAVEALKEGRNRVRSIALIHQNLYQVENLSAIELNRFVNDLCRQVSSIFKKQKEVKMNINVPASNLDIDTAVPLGLIMNELLSNSFKYAFNEVEVGEITLEICKLSEENYELEYSDNGPGLPLNYEFSKATTLGMQLINDLSRQVGGHMQYQNINGAVFTILFTNRDSRKNKD